MQAGTKTERQSNMELLRIFAVAGVIVLHFNAKALPAASGATRWALLLLEMVSACAVNVFVMLSGYFLHRRQSVSIYKPLSLLLQLLVFRLVMHGIEIVLGRAEFTPEGLLLLLIPLDYFLVLYTALYMLSPYLNRLLALLDDRKFQQFLLLLVLLFSVWNYFGELLGSATGLSFVSSSTIGIHGGQEGYTIVNFVLCYCLGAALGRGALAFRHPGWLFLGCLSAELLIARHNMYLSIQYLNPFLICQAACAVLLAGKLRFQNMAVNRAAGAALSVYMIHMHVLAYFDPAGCAGRGCIGALACLMGIILTIYAAGIAAHFLYETAARPVRSAILKHIRFPEISL